MSLIKDAMQFIAKQSNLNVLHTPDIDAANRLLLHDGDLKKTDLQQYLPNSDRYRASFATDRIESFNDYVKTVSKEESDELPIRVFVDSMDMSAGTVLDAFVIGADNDNLPGHCGHKAALKLTKHPDYQELIKVSDRWLPQKAMAEFIEGIGYAIEGVEPLLSQLKALKLNATNNAEGKVSNAGHERSAFEQVDIQSDDPLPELINVQMMCYPELSEKQMPMRLLVRYDEGFHIKLKFVNHATTVEQLALEMRAKMDVFDTENITVMDGRIKMSGTE